LLLDERSGVSYPDGVQDRDGLIWITYDRDRGGDGEILLAKFREEDVAAGKNASGAVVLKQTISKLEKPVAKPRGEVNRSRIRQIVSVALRVTVPQIHQSHQQIDGA